MSPDSSGKAEGAREVLPEPPESEEINKSGLMRKTIAMLLFVIACAHIFSPSKVALDWNTLILFAGAVSLGYAHKLRDVLPFIDSIEWGKAKVTLRLESKKFAQAVNESVNAETLEAEKKPIGSPLQADNDQRAVLLREKRLTDTSRESKILQIAAVDKFTAILQIGTELEAEIFLLAAMVGLRNRARLGTFRETAELLHQQGLITSDTLAALVELYRLRSKIAHAQYPFAENDPVLKSFLDSGLRLLRLIKNIPRPIYQVRQAEVPLFKDENCTQRIDDVVGVLLEVTETDGSKKLRIFPAGRKFKEGEIVGWDWDTTRGFGPAYFIDPETKAPKPAWSESLAFTGLNEDLRFRALRDNISD